MNLLYRYKTNDKNIALTEAKHAMLNELIERYRTCMYGLMNGERNTKYKCTGAIKECQQCTTELIDKYGMLKILKEINKYSHYYGPRELGIVTGHCKNCAVKDYQNCKDKCLKIILVELESLIK